MKKSFGEAAKFLLVSCIVGVIQLVLVNALYFGLKGWTAPLPEFLRGIFSASAVGEGNENWGYVLPFLVSNAAANIYGYFQNRKTTFRAENVPRYCLAVYLVVLIALILFSTWLQGVLVNRIVSIGSESLARLAPTIAMVAANTLQLLILFPLEKFVLFRDRSRTQPAA